MKKSIEKIGIFLIVCLFFGLNGNVIAQDSVVQDESIPVNGEEGSTPYYATGGILLPDSEMPNILPLGLDEAPVYWDWRDATLDGVHGNWMTSVKNQGKCGSCWAFAAIGTLEAMLNIHLKDPGFDLDLSEQQLVSCCTIGSNGCHGGSTYYSWQYLHDNGGAILESYFPYEEVDANGCQLSGDCDFEPVLCSDKKENWDYLQIPVDEEIGGLAQPDRATIRSLIANHGPVAAYITVYSDLRQYNGGIYRHRYGNVGGGHVVTLVGYDDQQEYWIAKNSWGRFWGEDGYFRIAYGECDIEAQILYVSVDEEQLNFPPSASCGGVYHADSGETVFFNSADSSDFDNDIVSYHWDFGDGTTSDEMNPSHSYDEEGMYSLTLTVTDEHGRTDTDESAVFVDIWDVGDFWEYDVSFITDEQSLYPPMYLPGSGSISNLRFEVVDRRDGSYVLDFEGDFDVSLAMNVDRENGFLNFRMWSKISRGSIEGSLVVSKAGFGIEQSSIRVRGFGQLLALPIVPLPIWLPVPIDITVAKTYDEPRYLMSKVPEMGKQWEIPLSNSSMDLTFAVVFGLLSKTFNAPQFSDENDTLVSNGLTSVTTSLGTFDAYEIVSIGPYRNLELFYSPELRNVVSFNGGGGEDEIIIYSGELVSSNLN